MSNNKFSEDWIRDCIRFHGKVLTGEKGHWCWDYDDLPIDETCEEYENCICNK